MIEAILVKITNKPKVLTVLINYHDNVDHDTGIPDLFSSK